MCNRKQLIEPKLPTERLGRLQLRVQATQLNSFGTLRKVKNLVAYAEALQRYEVRALRCGRFGQVAKVDRFFNSSFRRLTAIGRWIVEILNCRYDPLSMFRLRRANNDLSFSEKHYLIDQFVSKRAGHCTFLRASTELKSKRICVLT